MHRNRIHFTIESDLASYSCECHPSLLRKNQQIVLQVKMPALAPTSAAPTRCDDFVLVAAAEHHSALSFPQFVSCFKVMYLTSHKSSLMHRMKLRMLNVMLKLLLDQPLLSSTVTIQIAAYGTLLRHIRILIHHHGYT